VFSHILCVAKATLPILTTLNILTGKTSTITFLIRLLAAHGKRVLVTSYTNAAVDNVVLKLMAKGVSATNASQPLPSLVRIGRSGDCHKGVLPVMATTIALDSEKKISKLEDDSELTLPSATSLRRAIDSAKIVAVTALTAPRSPQLLGQHFDVVIVDEAGQISQTAIIGALMAADRFVLVGDHMQLPPLVSSELAEKGGEFAGIAKSVGLGWTSSLTCVR
jgi:DNA replication ATP-dependent helicase Dna2